MYDPNQPIDCPNFRTMQQLVEGFGTISPEMNGVSCTGCPNMMLIGGLMTCKHLHGLNEKGQLEL